MNGDQCPTAGESCCLNPVCNSTIGGQCVPLGNDCAGEPLDALCPIGEKCCPSCGNVGDLEGSSIVATCVPK